MRRPVGIRSAQCISRTITQSNLSSFHQAGTISEGERPVPTIQQIINGQVSDASCSMVIEFDRNCAYEQAPIFHPVLFRGLVLTMEQFPYTQNFWDSLRHRNMSRIWNTVIEGTKIETDSVVFVYHMKHLEMLRCHVKLDDVTRVIKKVVGGGGDTYIYKSLEIVSDILVITKETSVHDCIQCLSYDIGGFPQEDNHPKREHSLEYHVLREDKALTRGSDLRLASRVSGVNMKSIDSNHPEDVSRSFGIEATRGVVFRTLKSQCNETRSCSIVANFMTQTGKIRPFKEQTSHVMNLTSEYSSGPFLSMALERAKEDIQTCIKVRCEDDLRSIYSRLVFTPLTSKATPNTEKIRYAETESDDGNFKNEDSESEHGQIYYPRDRNPLQE